MKLSSVLVVVALIFLGYFLSKIQSDVPAQVFAADVPASVAFYGEVDTVQCTVDPITGQRTCQPVRKAAKVAANVVSSVASGVVNVVRSEQPTYSSVGSSVSYGSYGTSYTQSVSESVSYGSTGSAYTPAYSPTYRSSEPVKTFLAAQPVRSVLRRIARR